MAAVLSASANAASCQISAYSCLASNSAASAYCTSALGVATEGVVTVLDVISRTTTLTDVPTSTITITSTDLIVSKTTSTTFTTSSAKASKRRRGTEPCDTAEDILSGLDKSELSEACSCIGALPSSEASLLPAEPSTTTLTGEVWFTVVPEVTTSITQTITTTSISTVKKPKPSFTQVWGPKVGCDDVGMKSTQTFMLSTLNESQVTDICKGTCIKKPDCMFLMVQSIYPANHFWNCYYNDHTFNEKKDLNCSKDTSIWGTAKGYNVIGRG
ncbi:hypothetical protein M436DRAFT_80292 [Aureobasidium namibiae CBS 147.97]|uniref:Uncharacterized protein n=1 Tax=Aureobasidium namibiae CBS 147.97 TaxID=1043004 RepID=A0A074WNX2_9PEZI|nr:uncharacterized protein M436DRAFT_80292 [Aureobasidium namibiae CBS 147.97]KEQ74830.1 hypothetical protein M436DRAFT_80292 [Aureobasidium namibiae CBS 147.97]